MTGKAVECGRCSVHLPPQWEIQMELQDLVFGLIQPRPLGNEPENDNDLSCFLSVCLSTKQNLKNKERKKSRNKERATEESLICKIRFF